MKNKLIQISAWIAAHITLVVVLVTAVALFLPSSFNWIDTSAITPMLGVVMFGMGLTLRPSDFRPVLQHPKDILVGELAQFLIMPSLAWLLCKLLSLPEELALGVILVGCCPGGTASNVICYLAKGDVALSVAMTGVSTLLAPIVTPALVWLLAGESVEVDVAGMFLSIVQVVIVPIVLGVAANHYFQRTTRRIVPLLPMISTLSIAFIIGIIVAHNAASILACSLIVAVAVILHNVLGLALAMVSPLLSEASRPNGRPSPSRWACKIQVWPLHLPPLILPCFPWRPYLEPCSRYGTTSRAALRHRFSEDRQIKNKESMPAHAA